MKNVNQLSKVNFTQLILKLFTMNSATIAFTTQLL